MAQITVDTNNDTIEELEHAVVLIRNAIDRRSPSKTASNAQHHTKRMDMPVTPEPQEETALDTPFLKITVKNEEHKPEVPTLNELLTDEQLTEDDLKKLYKEVIPETEKKVAKETPERKQDAFIEIIDYEKEN